MRGREVSGFLAEISSFAAVDLLVAPEDREREMERNTFWIPIPCDEDGHADDTGIDAEDVRAALTEMAAVLRQRFASARSLLTGYAWCDEQAGQLRMSMCSAAPDALPFGGPYRPDTDPTAVSAAIAAVSHPGLISWC
ncbi:hypothetical protein [Nonomuraea africana]|uniref:hypothetical protein n=1 Tax=Nonomuraea africana TaxID=46171 RepID=UPI0033D70A1B